MNPWVRRILIVLAVLVAVYVLFTIVFPWVEINYITNPVLE